MARSGQQHTARLLAHMLSMNYAWGLEFVELTNGDALEQERTKGMYNLHGLHGSAILAKCKLHEPVIFRDDVGRYFSDRRIPINAWGYEKRLGGRMGMYARVQVSGGQSLVVGCTHKLQGYANEIRQYIGSRKAVSAGDQKREFCHRIGLPSVDDPEHATWPASCEGFGNGRGDNICSNLEVVVPEATVKPCFERFGVSSQLSDHALTMVTLGF